MLGKNLAMLRNLHGYSQEEIACEIGVCRQAYAKWESGATVPDIEKCAALAGIYGVSLDSLLSDNSAGNPEQGLPCPPGKNIWGSATLNERGQIVIPKAVREIFSLNPGSRVIVLSDAAEGIALIPAEIFEKNMKTAMLLASMKN